MASSGIRVSSNKRITQDYTTQPAADTLFAAIATKSADMKYLRFWGLLLGLNIISMLCQAQARPTPSEVTSSFTKMFPEASDVQWRDKINNFAAFFKIKGVQCEAKFSPAGSWISTEEAIQWDSLPPIVTDSLKSCKYADWKGMSAYLLQTSDGKTQYHVVVAKSDLGRKLLIFSPNGRLLADH